MNTWKTLAVNSRKRQKRGKLNRPPLVMSKLQKTQARRKKISKGLAGANGKASSYNSPKLRMMQMALTGRVRRRIRLKRNQRSRRTCKTRKSRSTEAMKKPISRTRSRTRMTTMMRRMKSSATTSLTIWMMQRKMMSKLRSMI